MLESSSLTGSSKTSKKRGWTSEHYSALIRRLQTTGKDWTDAVPHAIGVTSCTRGQGVTTVASNMAIAAAKVSIGPVLLVDANAHKPAVGRMFRVKSPQGLLNALTGEQAVFDCLTESPIANLSLLLSGKLKKNEQISYSPTLLDELLDNLKHVFRLIVFDLPPAHPLTTCFSFAARLDGILLVIEAEKVHRDVALRARKQLAEHQANLLGVVVNKHIRRFGDRAGRRRVGAAPPNTTRYLTTLTRISRLSTVLLPLKKLGHWRRRSRQRLPSVEQFRATLERERSRSDRSNSPVSLIAFDLHRASDDVDNVLGKLARCLQQRLRVTDDFGLMAADRLGVVLPDTPAHGAWKLAADVRDMLAPDANHVTCEVFEYPDTELPQEPRRRSDDVLSSPDRPVRSMIELFCQPLPRWKRAFDIFAAGAGLALLSPFFLAVGIAVRISSPGPILFRQPRRGLSGRPFLMYKFRSMIDGADQLQDELRHLNERDGPAFKIGEDPRVTSLGRVLRATKIDEFPQLWNVLKGEMSMVGPRPLPCCESDACHRWHRRRLEVTPGITCLWQVKDRRSLSFDEWARMDICYARRRSFWQDIKLLLHTPFVMWKRDEQ